MPLLIQQNVDGSAYFNRSWETFKAGFGTKASCNYWLGNEQLHQLTKDGEYKLRFDLQAFASGHWYWADYSTFIVDNETTNYTIGGYSGNAGDAMSYHNGGMFTTFDRDNDGQTNGNCAIEAGGGFWYTCNDTDMMCARADVNSAAHVDGALWFGLPEIYKMQACRTGSCVVDIYDALHK